jgi:hypothetical protein
MANLSGSYFDNFSHAVLSQALSDVSWFPVGGPPAHHVALHHRVIRLCLPDVTHHATRLKAVDSALQVLNGDWSRPSVAHHCVLNSSGQPCCRDIHEVKEKVKKAITKLLLGAKPPVPCSSRRGCAQPFGKLYKHNGATAFGKSRALAATCLQRATRGGFGYGGQGLPGTPPGPRTKPPFTKLARGEAAGPFLGAPGGVPRAFPEITNRIGQSHPLTVLDAWFCQMVEQLRWLTTSLCGGWWGLGFCVHTLFPGGFLRAWPSAVDMPALAADRQGVDCDSDSDKDDSFAVKLGKRVNRGRRNMSDQSFDVNLVISLTLLLPLHFPMASLFKASQTWDHDDLVSTVASSVDRCMAKLVDISESDVRDSAGMWFAVHLTRAGGEVFADDGVRRYCRKELLRICGGYVMRLVTAMNAMDVQMWLAIELCTQAETLLYASRCRRSPCCVSSSTHRFYEWMRSATYDELCMAKQSWCPSILATDYSVMNRYAQKRLRLDRIPPCSR